jgi:KDO2-lipid IV(A) lauroyltransferase
MSGKSKKQFRDSVVVGTMNALLGFGRKLPESLLYAVGDLVGSFAYSFDSRNAKVARENLQIAFPQMDESEREEILRAAYTHLGYVLLEISKIPAIDKNVIADRFSFEGLEIAEKAIESGRGLVIATGHIGNWEMMGAAASVLGIPVNVIARAMRIPALNEVVDNLRGSSGVKTIHRESRSSGRSILRALRNGEMLALLIDQDIKAEGAFVDFFGRPAFTPTGAAILARKTGAVLAAAAVQRTSPGHHLIRLKEIEFASSDDEDRVIIEATQAVTWQLEKWIRDFPEQWVWIHKRWKSKPEDRG